jgi:3-methyl-2-oxobutanoate hydroxymethyltransferase
MAKKMTITKIMQAKNTRQLVMITAYDALFAKLFEESADILLVGDSLNMSFAGKSDTLSATIEQMIYHTNAVCNGSPQSFVICDMPFGTYVDESIALQNAIEIFRHTSADALKVEVSAAKAHIVRHLTNNGIAVCGHIGLLPQSVRGEGGYKVKGKDEASTAILIEDAKALEAAGVFCIILEGVKADTGGAVAKSVQIPVIGIGAGNQVDGQVLVYSDMLGLFEAFTPKFVKKYLEGASLVKDAVAQYASDVQSGKFPTQEHMY